MQTTREDDWKVLHTRGPRGMAGIPENCCISVVLAPWTVHLGTFILKLSSCSPTLVLPAEIVCPGISTLSTPNPLDLGLHVICTGLGVPALLCTVA